MRDGWFHRHAGLLAVNLLCLLTLLPFITKPFHIDDPLFLWSARQIRQQPTNPYGFDVNWYGYAQPMAQVTKNPPLTCYYLAAWSILFGWSELATHAAMLLPALGLASCTYLLARRMCPESAFLAAVAATVAPVTLVSASTVMCDVPMLCFYVWAIYFHVRGIDEDRLALLMAAAASASTAAMLKYFGATVLPLMLVYSLLSTHRIKLKWLAPLLLPVAVLVAYQLWTRSIYGRGLLLDAAGYATGVRWSGGTSVIASLVAALAFAGGCCATVTLWVLLTGPTRHAIIFAIVAFILLILLVMTRPFPEIRQGPTLFFQAALFAAGGFVLLQACVVTWWRNRRDAKTTLLLLWIVGTLIFAAALNWTINGRSVLPMAAPAAMLVIGSADMTLNRRAVVAGRVAIILGGFIALAVTFADESLARTEREAGDIVAEKLKDYAHGRYFIGHWGFQWYLERHGFASVDIARTTLQPDDLVLVPANNSNVYKLSALYVHPAATFEVKPAMPLVGTMHKSLGAGFYSDGWGPLPFAFGAVPPDGYQVEQVLQPIVLRTRALPATRP